MTSKVTIIYCETADDYERMINDNNDCGFGLPDHHQLYDIHAFPRSIWIYYQYPHYKQIEFAGFLRRDADFNGVSILRYDRVPK